MKNEKRTGLLRKYSKKIPPKSHKPNSLQKIELKKIELKSSIQRCTELVNLSRAAPYNAVQYCAVQEYIKLFRAAQYLAVLYTATRNLKYPAVL